MKKVKIKSVKFWSVLCIIGLLGMLLYATVENNEIKKILSERNTLLDVDEYTKQWVLDDIRTILCIKDDASYIEAKEKTHLSKEIKARLLGDSYLMQKSTLLNADNVGFIDAQYTLVNDDKVFYILANVYKGDTVKELNILVYVYKNSITNLIVY